jgi:hypothetical protein
VVVGDGHAGFGACSCIAMLMAIYVDLLLKRLHVRFLARPIVAVLNWSGKAARPIGRHRPQARTDPRELPRRRRGVATRATQRSGT